MMGLKLFILSTYTKEMQEEAMFKLEAFLNKAYPWGYYMPKSFEETVKILNRQEIEEWLNMSEFKVSILSTYTKEKREAAMNKLQAFLDKAYPWGYCMPESFDATVKILNRQEIEEWLA